MANKHKRRRVDVERPFLISFLAFFGIVGSLALLTLSRTDFMQELLSKIVANPQEELNKLSAIGGVMAIIFIGIWRMKKWAFIAYGAVSLAGIYYQVAVLHGSVPGAQIVIPATILYLGMREWYQLT